MQNLSIDDAKLFESKGKELKKLVYNFIKTYKSYIGSDFNNLFDDLEKLIELYNNEDPKDIVFKLGEAFEKNVNVLVKNLFYAYLIKFTNSFNE